MSQDDLKRVAAKAALEYVDGGIVGVGTGSAANVTADSRPTIGPRKNRYMELSPGAST